MQLWLAAPVKSVRSIDPEGKRAAILAAGEALFASTGFAKTSMAQVASRADVAVGSVYRAFPDKLALLVALHEAMETEFIAVLLRSWDTGQSPEPRFRAMVSALFHHADSVRASMPLYMLTRDLVSSGGQEPGAQTIMVIADLYGAAMERGEFIEMRPDMAAAIGYGMIEGGMRDWMKAGANTTDLPVAIETITSCFVRAFACN